MDQSTNNQSQKKLQITPDKYRQPLDADSTRVFDELRELVNYGPDSHVRIWYNTQSEEYSLHYHDTLEAIYCIENKYRVKIGDVEYLMNAGDILFIPPNLLHEIPMSDPGIRFIYLFDVSMLKEFQDYKLLSSTFNQALLVNSKTCPNIYHDISERMIRIVDIYFSNCTMWETKIYFNLLHIFLQVYEDYMQINTIHAADSMSDEAPAYSERFTSFLNYVDIHYAEEITLDDAAKAIGFSKYHFTRIFKQHTGFTFHEYLNHKRIQVAQSLLAADLSITDIAFQTGFNNLTSFCRCFKKYAGTSPSEYRKLFDPETTDKRPHS
ncbi:MAG: AraC family transcriptional regulator [Lachnospiraceae bacterium]|nr:AraC family transcriptional regulator [Lachnospiraceae bacterium]